MKIVRGEVGVIMERSSPWIHEFSRFVLGIIRIVNGAAALGMPQVVARRLGIADSQGVSYVLRLFGVRTVLLGVELVFLRGKRLEWSVQVAPVIHASDTVSAVIAGLCRQLPPRAAVLTVLISATNTVLALLAQGAFGAVERSHGRDLNGWPPGAAQPPVPKAPVRPESAQSAPVQPGPVRPATQKRERI